MADTGNLKPTPSSVQVTSPDYNERSGEAARSNDIIEKQSSRKKVTIHKYPTNLGSSEQPHSINFYISQYVPGANPQKLRAANAASSNLLGIPSARTGNELTFENAEGIGKTLASAVTFAGAVAGAAIGRAASSTVTSNKTAQTAAAAGVALGGAKISNDIAKDATSLKATPAVRIRDVISLHIPQSPQAKYGANFENESIGTVLGVLAQQGGDIAALQNATAGGLTGELVARGLADAATIPKEFGLGNANFGGLARAASKKVRNPFQEQIFKTMNFRTFAFQYKFAPRNAKELQSVLRIIDLFKYHMHPEKSPTGAFFTFPSVFDIEYRYKDQRNNFVNKIATSVLVDLSVDYGSEGVMTTFRDSEGAPSEITMAMQFREIVLLSKDPNSEKLTDGSLGGNY